MTRREFLALGLLLGCSEDEIMNRKQKLALDWWSGGGSFDPSQLSNKAFWFDATTPADGEVTSWTDKFLIGNAVAVGGRNTPNKITDGGMPAVEFTRANNEILRIPAISGIVTYTLFLVVKAKGTTNNQKIIGNGGASDTTHGFDVNIQTDNFRINNRNTGSQQQKSFAFTDITDYHVITVKFQSKGTSATVSPFSRTVFKQNNIVKVTDGDAKPLFTSSVGFDIGSDAVNVSFDGYIREIICVKEWMNESTERKVYQYLNTKWGLTVTTTMPAYTFPGVVQTGVAATLGTANLVNDIFEYSNSENTKPVLIAMHGYTDVAILLGADFYTRMANLGFFVLGVQMRGRQLSTGTRDSSGQEIYDIYDVYQNILTQMSSLGAIVDSSKVCIVGHSGGGGNTYSFVTKFPDLCAAAVINFGMSDYGYDSTYSWYIQEPSRQAQLNSDVGSPRTSFLNEYRTRNSVEAIAKNYNGTLFIFHDDQDTAVDIPQSSRVKDAFNAEGKIIQETKYNPINSNTQLYYSITTTSDSPRWIHANPTGSNSIIQAEPQWTPTLLNASPFEVSPSGTIRILGWVRTKKFFIMLGNGTVANDGKTRCADLTYDWINNSYTITPLLESGATDETVEITVIGGAHSGKTASGTISTATLFTPV